MLQSLRTWDAEHNAQQLTIPLEQQEGLASVLEQYKEAVPHDITDLDLHTMWYVVSPPPYNSCCLHAIQQLLCV